MKSFLEMSEAEVVQSVLEMYLPLDGGRVLIPHIANHICAELALWRLETGRSVSPDLKQ